MRRSTLFKGFVLYVVLLIASHWMTSLGTTARRIQFTSDNPPNVELKAIDANGSPIVGQTTTIYYLQWTPKADVPERVPVLLIHGAPGNAHNFDQLGPELAADNRRVYAPDLPGYGESPETPSMSFETDAHYLFELLDKLDVQRVHVVGWSAGSGTALEMANMHPDRVASVTMLAGIGAQETEGSGSYAFEHFKYLAGIALIGGVPELIPHFGLLGTWIDRTGWLWSFYDSDQRKIDRFMGKLKPPVLILHGRHDPLVAAWAAERHHEMIPNSKLVMFDASHFLPIMQVAQTREQLIDFFDLHDTPGVPAQTDYVDLAPVPHRVGGDALLHILGRVVRQFPWWLGIIFATLVVRWRANLGIVLIMLFVVLMDLDYAVAALGIIFGRAWWMLRGAGPLDRPRSTLTWARSVLFVIPAFGIGSFGGSWTLSLADRYDWLGLFVGVYIAWLAILTARLVFTWEGRQRIKAHMARLTNHEYYPAWVIYLPVLWAAFVRIATGKGLRPLTAVNPGYAHDGGLKEERKSEHDARFPNDPSVLRCAPLTPNPRSSERVEAAARIIDAQPDLGGYPIIAKPDQGERGRGVRLIRDKTRLHAYLQEHPEPVVLQRYHPGPIEVGIVWVRHPETIANPGSPAGFIYAVNKKELPEIIGDGRRSLRTLILRHPRYRTQAAMFLQRLREQQRLIPEDGERVPLGFAGNHAQGAKFTDGADLITPELSAKINAIASGFVDSQGRGFDIGRFDVRCASYEQLTRGEDLGIVELNGLSCEPTNLYDPSRTLFWAWGVILGYWRYVEKLADARIADGSGEPITSAEAWALLRDFMRVMTH